MRGGIILSNTAFFWDLDGTLFDSYPVITASMCRTLDDYGIPYDRAEVRRFVIRRSVKERCGDIAAQRGLDAESVYAHYLSISENSLDGIVAVPHALEVLEGLSKRGCPHFVYTHRGASALTILDHLGMLPFFTEILTAEDGFPRKPDPTAIQYLQEKHGLDPRFTWYVGDRSLDMEAAVRAGVNSILYLAPDSPASPTGKETLVVHDLLEIPTKII